jgi:hypothetical protein
LGLLLAGYSIILILTRFLLTSYSVFLWWLATAFSLFTLSIQWRDRKFLLWMPAPSKISSFNPLGVDQKLLVGTSPEGLFCSRIQSNNVSDSGIHNCAADSTQLFDNLPDKLILWTTVLWEPTED